MKLRSDLSLALPLLSLCHRHTRSRPLSRVSFCLLPCYHVLNCSGSVTIDANNKRSQAGGHCTEKRAGMGRVRRHGTTPPWSQPNSGFATRIRVRNSHKEGRQSYLTRMHARKRPQAITKETKPKTKTKRVRESERERVASI